MKDKFITYQNADGFLEIWVEGMLYFYSRAKSIGDEED